MSEEIKAILDYLKDGNWDYYPGDGIPYKVFLIQERDLLLNYITNLQQEIEQLEKENIKQKEIIENLTTMTVCGDRKQIKNTAQYKLEQLENIRKEAIKYINDNSLYEEDYDYDYEENIYLAGINDEQAKKALLNILNKGSESNE